MLFIYGGGCGIRTHVGLLPNGFQDRLVMTASITLRVIARRGLRSGSASAESAAWFIGEADITLRVCYLIVFFLAFRILDRDHFGQVFYRLENGVF